MSWCAACHTPGTSVVYSLDTSLPACACCGMSKPPCKPYKRELVPCLPIT